MTQIKYPLSALFIALATIALPAHADNEARQAILELRVQLKATIQTVEAQGNRISELNQELAKLRGQQETSKNTLDTVKAEQESGFQSLSDRIRVFEPKTPEELAQIDFDKAMALVQSNDYAAALKAFDNHAKKYPNSDYAPQVEFWRGSSAYGTRNYKLAITYLTRFITKNPSHEKLPDAMLTLGSAQIESGKKTEGSATLQNLIAQFPSSDAATTAAKLITAK